MQTTAALTMCALFLQTWKEIEVGLSINDAIEATGGLTKVQAALLGIQWAVMGALCLSCVFTRDSISGASAVAGGLSLAALGHGETAQLFGIMISAICSGWHSNTYGRRQAVLLSSGLLAAGELHPTHFGGHQMPFLFLFYLILWLSDS